MKQSRMKRELINSMWKNFHDEVDRIAQSGWYADQNRANRFVGDNIFPIWRQVLGISGTDAQLIRELDITPTMMSMLHLYAASVHKIRVKGRRLAPVFDERCWPPYINDGAVFRIPAIPKNSIATLVGKTISSVDRAVDGFRGKKGKTGLRLYDKRLVFPAPFATGIMLDGIMAIQMSFQFVYPVQSYNYQVGDYEHLRGYSIAQRREGGYPWTLTIDWSRGGISSLCPTPANVVRIGKPETGTGTEGK